MKKSFGGPMDGVTDGQAFIWMSAMEYVLKVANFEVTP